MHRRQADQPKTSKAAKGTSGDRLQRADQAQASSRHRVHTGTPPKTVKASMTSNHPDFSLLQASADPLLTQHDDGIRWQGDQHIESPIPQRSDAPVPLPLVNRKARQWARAKMRSEAHKAGKAAPKSYNPAGSTGRGKFFRSVTPWSSIRG